MDKFTAILGVLTYPFIVYVTARVISMAVFQSKLQFMKNLNKEMQKNGPQSEN